MTTATTTPTATLIGKVKWFNAEKGYSFIEAEDGADVFVHYSAIAMEGYRFLAHGQEVWYCAFESPKGRQASRVEVKS